MTKEQLRLQMLAGIITESEYKAKLNEQTDTDFVRSEMERHIGMVNDNPDISDLEKKRRIDNIRFVVYDFLDPNTNGGKRPSSDFQFDDNWWNSISPDIDKWVVDDAATDLVRAAKGASFGENDKPLNEKDSLNEHYVAGGIVGIGAINQIPSRTKEVYEDAFEHFLGERYQLKPNRERDDIKDINEEEDVEEAYLGHNVTASLTPEGRFWIVSWRGMNGTEEKVFTDEDEARTFMNTLEEGKEVEEPSLYEEEKDDSKKKLKEISYKSLDDVDRETSINKLKSNLIYYGFRPLALQYGDDKDDEYILNNLKNIMKREMKSRGYT